MELKQQLISESKYDIKCPYSMTPIGIVIHNTANDASAKNEIAYMVNNNNEVSYHIAVDDTEAIQAIPFTRNTWNAGDGGSGNGNRKHIAIETCYSKSGGDKFIKAEINCALITAKLLKQYGWGIDKVKKHQDFSGKYCPHRTLDLGWQRFLNMVQSELNGVPSEPQIPSPQPTPKPRPPLSNGDYLFLNAHVIKWNVYPTNVAPVIGNQCGSLSPSQFGGIEYKILGNPQADVYTIQTQSYGLVNIYVPKDGDSKFYSKGGTTIPVPQPTPSNKKYLNLHKHNTSWRVYGLTGDCTVGSEVGSLAPANYGGLSYEILKDEGDIKTIQTGSFGKVRIYAPRDNDSSITSNPIY